MPNMSELSEADRELLGCLLAIQELGLLLRSHAPEPADRIIGACSSLSSTLRTVPASEVEYTKRLKVVADGMRALHRHIEILEHAIEKGPTGA